MIKITGITVGSLGTNCYIIYDDNTMEGIVADPGGNGSDIIAKIRGMGINLKYIVFTHAHFDHIMAYPELVEAFPGAKLIVSHKEEPALKDGNISLISYYCSDFPEFRGYMTVKNGDIITFGDSEMKVIETPGHTAGSMSLYGDGVLVSGDTLFNCSIGRCDLPTGSIREETNSIINILFKLPDETKVYPGHGPETTIGFEKKNNEVYAWI